MNLQEEAHANLNVSMKAGPLALARVLWVVLLVFCLGYYIVSVPVHYQQLRVIVENAQIWMQLSFDEAMALRGLGISMSAYAAYINIIEAIMVIIFLAAAIFIFISRPDDGMAIYASATAIVFGVTSVPSIQALAATHSVWRLQVDLLTALGLGFPLVLFYIFPDGKFVPSWTRWLAVVWLAWVSLSAFVPALNPDRAPFPWPFLIKSLLFSTGIFAQIYRYFRRSSRVQRQQTKWVVFGFAAAFIGFLVFNLIFALSETINQPGLPRVLYIMAGYPLLALFPALLVPLAIGVAVLRYNLWDIDVLINQTLVYTVLTGILAAIYFTLVIVLQSLVSSLTGQDSPGFVTVITTLTIAGIFVPLRGRVQASIDQRFFRSKYDGQKILSAFNASLRDEIDLTRLIEHLEQVIFETMQPAYIFTWLKNGAGFKVYGFEADTRAEAPPDDPLIAEFRRALGLVVLDELNLESSYLKELRNHQVKTVLPLISRGNLIGWLTLGARLSGQEYTHSDRQLLEQLAAQAGPAVQVAHLLLKQKAEALERERMEYEMSLARNIQQTLLPGELPALAGWRSAAYYRPARSVGGDFYDFLSLPDGQMGIFIGDVTDKGIPAALVMAATRSILRSITLEVVSPAQVLEKANNLLVPDMPPSMFVTCLFLLFDPATGRVRFANAGHNLPMQWRSEEVIEWRATGMPLGLMPGMQYEEKEARLQPGEGLLLYTDGLVEAHNPAGAMFGSGKLREALKWYSLAHEGVIQALLAELDLFTGPAWEQEDDVTLVVISGDG